MPLIEDFSGESLLIKRLGIEYIDVGGIKYSIDSELVISDEYNIAVFFDSDWIQELDSNQKQHIVNRIYTLAKSKNILLKFFDETGSEIKPE